MKQEVNPDVWTTLNTIIRKHDETEINFIVHTLGEICSVNAKEQLEFIRHQQNKRIEQLPYPE